MADSYFVAAVSLTKQKLRTTHQSFPINLLFHHAAELYIKAFLRLKGHEVRGHSFSDLLPLASELGLLVEEFSLETMRLMDGHNLIISTRYLEPGLYENYPTSDRLWLLCGNLRDEVGRHLQVANIAIRALPPFDSSPAP